MFLKPYFSKIDQHFQFSRQQASHFAKVVAGDFNPIHDENSKRFCVPGDLLFAVLLQKEGVSTKMRFDFSGMVGDETPITITRKQHTESALVDNSGKEYLHMHHEGEVNKDPAFIEHVVTSYVQFSGKNFPHIMVPLMEEKQMMINCQRPLVIYESMSIEFTRLDLKHPDVALSDASFDIDGKRGVVTLSFDFLEDGEIVGHGAKRLVASGLRPYDKAAVDDLVARFIACKDDFLSKLNQAN